MRPLQIITGFFSPNGIKPGSRLRITRPIISTDGTTQFRDGEITVKSVQRGIRTEYGTLFRYPAIIPFGQLVATVDGEGNHTDEFGREEDTGYHVISSEVDFDKIKDLEKAA